MIDIQELKQAALAVSGWGNSNQAWLDTSEDVAAAVVGHIDEDGNEYQIITVDCEQYESGDSLPLAKFYAKANPSAVIELIERLKLAEDQWRICNLHVTQLELKLEVAINESK